MKSVKEAQVISLAQESLKKQDYKAAQKYAEEAICLNPKSIDGYFIMANLFHTQGELSKSIKAFKKVLELDANHTDAAISLSVVLNDIGQYEEGQRVFKEAKMRIKRNKQLGPNADGVDDPYINKRFAFKHFELGEMYFSYERYDESLLEYNKATRLDPDLLEVRVKVAKVYVKKGMVAKAIEDLKRLKSECPAYYPAYLALGIIYYGHGNVLEAQTEWQKVLRKDPGNQEALTYMNLSKGATETSL